MEFRHAVRPNGKQWARAKLKSGLYKRAMGRSPHMILKSGEFLELSGAVAEFLGRHSEVAKQRQLQIRQRRMAGINKVAAAFDRSTAAARDKGRQRAVGMAIAVADASSIQKDHVIEQ